jgi:hypothetical protein
MKNNVALVSFNIYIFLALWLYSHSASAVEFNLQPRINTGTLYYQFEQDAVFNFYALNPEDPNEISVFGPTSRVSYSDTMPFASIGLTAFIDRFSLDIYAQSAVSGEDRVTQQKGKFSSTTLTNIEGHREWDRKEYSISAGYAMTNTTAIFAGYRQSNTDFDQTTVASVIGNPEPFPPLKTNFQYDQKGPFAGVVTKWIVEKGGILNGVLGLNVGVAFIDGKLTSKSDDDGERFSRVIKGDTVGIMTGVSWGGSITDKLNYTLSFDHYRYDFKADNSDLRHGDPNSDEFLAANFSEMTTRTSIGISYLF